MAEHAAGWSMRDHQAVVVGGSFASREVFNPALSCSLVSPDVKQVSGGARRPPGVEEAECSEQVPLWCKLCQRCWPGMGGADMQCMKLDAGGAGKADVYWELRPMSSTRPGP